jgi:hypothetical protein
MRLSQIVQKMASSQPSTSATLNFLQRKIVDKVRGMTTLDKEKFNATVLMPSLKVVDKTRLNTILKVCKPLLPTALMHWKPVQRDDADPDTPTRIFFDPDKFETSGTAILQHIDNCEASVATDAEEIKFTYDNLHQHDVFFRCWESIFGEYF